MSTVEFKLFPKIPRLNREVVITEKIDGSNGCVFVGDDGTVLAGSRKRWITSESDNFGFARWVAANEEELRGLGPGYHYGEWWGADIQRRYGLSEKRFSLFNVARWGNNTETPSCCHVVPVLWRGIINGFDVQIACDDLRARGSVAAPGFMQPEGVVIYHTASGHLFKVTLENDSERKRGG